MNFLVRTLTGLFIVAAIAGCILGGYPWAVGLFGLISAASTVELIRICREGGTADASYWSVVPAVAAYLCSIALFDASCCPVEIMLVLFALSVVALLIIELYRRKSNPVLNIAVGLMPVAYIALPFSLIPVFGLWCGSQTGVDYNGILPLAMFVFIWCNDVGAYCVGCTMGRHRLFPRVSPKKSWEGSIGGAMLTVAAAAVVSCTMPERFGFLTTSSWITVAMLTVVFGTFGDLAESLVKRGLGIKDSGRILPGHGGFLDRFDSTLVALPAVAAYLLLRSVICQ